MILVDTSAWVEYLRATGSPVHLRVRQLIETSAPLATTEPVIGEVLAGARDAAHLRTLRRLLLGCEVIAVDGLRSWERAAAIWRQCRAQGATVRSLTDCLVAEVALRSGLAVLHADRDFDAIARTTGMRLA